MSGGSGKGDATYWPGFVDALTNVVIAMVFVIVVLAMALSFSAQLLAKRMAAKLADAQQEGLALRAATPQEDPPKAPTERPTAGPENAPLVATRTESNLPRKTVITVLGQEVAASGVGGQLKQAINHLSLEYEPLALTLDAAATERLVMELGAVKDQLAAQPGSRVQIVATGPAMELSDNQRSALLRVMAVRNVLLDQGIAADRIVPRVDTAQRSSKAVVSIVMEAKP